MLEKSNDGQRVRKNLLRTPSVEMLGRPSKGFSITLMAPLRLEGVPMFSFFHRGLFSFSSLSSKGLVSLSFIFL